MDFSRTGAATRMPVVDKDRTSPGLLTRDAHLPAAQPSALLCRDEHARRSAYMIASCTLRLWLLAWLDPVDRENTILSLLVQAARRPQFKRSRMSLPVAD